MKNVIFLGPPASGKGTLSERLAAKYGYVHIATGDLLREKRNDNSALAQEIIKYQDAGKLVPSHIVDSLLRQKLEFQDHSQGFVLDGYPRTHEQLMTLESLLKELNWFNYVVIYLETPYEEARDRMLGRMTCPKCERIYNKYRPATQPKEPGKCDDCQVTLITRTDDNEETFRKRFENYEREIKPILEYYRNKGLLQTVTVIELDTAFQTIEKMIQVETDPRGIK